MYRKHQLPHADTLSNKQTKKSLPNKVTLEDLKATFSLCCTQHWQLSAVKLKPQLPRSIHCDHRPSGYFSAVFNFNNYRRKRFLKKDDPGHIIRIMSAAMPREQFTTQWKMIFCSAWLFMRGKKTRSKRLNIIRWESNSGRTEGGYSRQHYHDSHALCFCYCAWLVYEPSLHWSLANTICLL